MSTIPRPHLSSLWTAVLFTLYFFVFLTSEVFLQDCLLALDRPEDLHIFFLGQMACLAAGYLSLSLCRRCAYGLLRSVAAAAMLFPALLFIALAFMGIPASLLLWAAACSYFLGGTGAFLHYSAALCLHRSAVTGRVAGGSIGLAVAIQFLTDTCLDSGQTAILLALVSLVLAMLLARTPAPATADEAPSAPPSRRTLALVTAGTAILSIVVGLNEDIVTRLYATGALDVTSWPRLCYLAGLLLAGFLADIRKRAFMPVITLCVLMLSNMAIFFLSDPRHYQLNLSILYFYSGFYVVYFTVLFLDLAPGTRWPLLWAGMGRLCRSLCGRLFSVSKRPVRPAGAGVLHRPEYPAAGRRVRHILLERTIARSRRRQIRAAVAPGSGHRPFRAKTRPDPPGDRRAARRARLVGSPGEYRCLPGHIGTGHATAPDFHLRQVRCERPSGAGDSLLRPNAPVTSVIRPAGLPMPPLLRRCPSPGPPPYRRGCRASAGDSPKNTRAPVTILAVTGARVLKKSVALDVIAQARGPSCVPARAHGASRPQGRLSCRGGAYSPAMKPDQRASRARRALPRWLRAFFSSRVSWAALLRMLSSQNRGS